MPARRLRITGIVQGVFFRAHAKEMADQLGLTGWVRNCPDGSVEALAEGSEAALKTFEQWCHKGPSGAQVRDVETKEAPPEGNPTFEVRY